jgi:L-alanine-DL-glutamate epimerase-like enolase superfamily enzyme
VLKDFLAPAILGEDPFDIEKLTYKMDEVIGGYQIAKAGISIALYDCIAKSLDLPVYELLGGLYRRKIPVCFTVSWGENTAEEALRYIKAGFKSIKVKIGRSIEEDVKSLEEVREFLGHGVPILADANQRYNPLEAIELVQEISELVQALEQPVHKSNIKGMANVRRSSEIPIIADESAPTSKDAIQIVRQDAADMFLIKVMRSGGFIHSKNIVAIGQAAGMKNFACSMTELGIGTAANLHFAASTPALFDDFGFSFDGPMQIFGGTNTVNMEDIVLQTPILKDGAYEIPKGPGLGVVLNEENIEKYRNGNPVKIFV